MIGLSWQQGPLATGAIGRFLVPVELPERVLFAEPLRRRMRVRFGDTWIADSEDVVLLHEPGRYPVAYFPLEDVVAGRTRSRARDRTTHQATSATPPGTRCARARPRRRAAWQHVEPPARERAGGTGRVRLAGDGRVLRGGRAHPRPRCRRVPPDRHPPVVRHLVVRAGDRVVADSSHPLVMYESGFAPRWYVPREDVDEAALTPVEGQTFCPYKGLCSYYDIGDARGPRGRTRTLRPRSADLRDGLLRAGQGRGRARRRRLRQEPGQTVISHGIDRDLTVEELSG